MVSSRRKIIPPKIDIKIDNQSVIETDLSKFLGVYIETDLENSHIVHRREDCKGDGDTY